MSESEREQILDRRVQARLAVDAAYRNAETADEQSEREAAIEAEEAGRLELAAGVAELGLEDHPAFAELDAREVAELEPAEPIEAGDEAELEGEADAAEPELEPDPIYASPHYWLGYLLCTVRLSAEAGDAQALQTLRTWQERSPMASDRDARELGALERKAAKQ